HPAIGARDPSRSTARPADQQPELLHPRAAQARLHPDAAPCRAGQPLQSQTPCSRPRRPDAGRDGAPQRRWEYPPMTAHVPSRQTEITEAWSRWIKRRNPPSDFAGDEQAEADEMSEL